MSNNKTPHGIGPRILIEIEEFRLVQHFILRYNSYYVYQFNWCHNTPIVSSKIRYHRLKYPKHSECQKVNIKYFLKKNEKLFSSHTIQYNSWRHSFQNNYDTLLFYILFFFRLFFIRYSMFGYVICVSVIHTLMCHIQCPSHKSKKEPKRFNINTLSNSHINCHRL